MKQSFTSIEVKSVTPEANHYIVTGTASTPDIDLAGDIVEPTGVEYSLPLPLLTEHDRGQPVGQVVDVKVSPAGINFTAHLPKVPEAGIVRDRIIEAVHNLKHRLIRGVSIGFSGLDYEPLRTGGKRFKRWRWLELSLVTVPCNPAAAVATVKALELEQPKHSVHAGPVKLITRRRYE